MRLHPQQPAVCSLAGGGGSCHPCLPHACATAGPRLALPQDAGRQSRQVRLLCACVALVLQRQPGALAESLPELLAFCIQASARLDA